MAVVLLILIALFALPVKTGVANTTDNSPASSKLYVYNTLSEVVFPELNNISSTFGVDYKTHSRVSTSSDVKTMAVDNTNSPLNTDIIPTTTDTADNTVGAVSVASVSVPGQAAHSKTVRSTSSAMNSGRDTTVIVTSGNTDTVSGSVPVSTENDNFNPDGMFTSMTVTTVPTTVSSFDTESPTTITKDCEGMLCEKDAGHFVINTTACVASERDSPTIVTSIPTTVEILTNENCVSPDILCFWNIKVPLLNYVNVTIDQLVLEKDDGNGTQSLELYVENDYKIQVFNTSVLRNRSVTFTSSSSVLFFRFRGQNLCPNSAITFHFHVQLGTAVVDLSLIHI